VLLAQQAPPFVEQTDVVIDSAWFADSSTTLIQEKHGLEFGKIWRRSLWARGLTLFRGILKEFFTALLRLGCLANRAKLLMRGTCGGTLAGIVMQEN
jgi:hypothetical protein